MKDLRVKISLKNNILISKREELQFNQKQMSEFLDIPLEYYMGFENLSKHPNNSNRWMKAAKKMANMLDTDLEVLFPESLTKIRINKKEFSCDSQTLNLLSCQPTQILQIESQELHQTINKVLKTLTPIEEKVIRRSFGTGSEKETENNIAEDFNVSTARINQVKCKALRKLRHWSRQEIIKEVL